MNQRSRAKGADREMIAPAGFEPVFPGVVVLDGVREFSVASFNLLRDAIRGLLSLQHEIQRSLASEFRAAYGSTSVLSPIVLILTAFAFGAVHAVTPGHGKSVVASYFLGQSGAPRRGFIMSAKVIATHVLSAIVLVLAATFLVHVSFGAKPVDYPAVRLISYAGVTAVGSWLLRQSLRREHALAWHGPAAREGALPYFAGLSPCPLTTMIMVVALANGMVVLGLLVSLSMALGMTVTVTLFALAVILSRRWLLTVLQRHAARVDRVGRVLEIAGASAVTLVGLLLLVAELA
jgi:ABC-type nickel/cobalt efflux system permease component RcnA